MKTQHVHRVAIVDNTYTAHRVKMYHKDSAQFDGYSWKGRRMINIDLHILQENVLLFSVL